VSGKPVPHLLSPEVVRISHWEDPEEKRVANWIKPWDFKEPIDVGLLMVPLSRGAIKHVATHQGPNHIRMVWPFFTTYSIDFDVDVVGLRVRDLGDVEIPLLDVPQAHRNIEEAVRGLLSLGRDFFLITLGGEHSMEHAVLKAFKEARNYKRLGLIQFDGHMDFQRHYQGPHNGTPMRRILEDGLVDPKNMVQIGISGFVQAKSHALWGRNLGVTIFTARDVHRQGIEGILTTALDIAGNGTDGIYVSFDIDSMDQAYAPGTGASLPGGLTPWQAYEALFQLGRDDRVVGFDIVEVDPSTDVNFITARLATKLLLTFLAGYYLRHGGPGS
jgi:formiminoglutamase